MDDVLCNLRNAAAVAVAVAFVCLPPPARVNPSHNNTIDDVFVTDSNSANVVIATLGTEKKDLRVTTSKETTDFVAAAEAAVTAESTSHFETENEDRPLQEDPPF